MTFLLSLSSSKILSINHSLNTSLVCLIISIFLFSLTLFSPSLLLLVNFSFKYVWVARKKGNKSNKRAICLVTANRRGYKVCLFESFKCLITQNLNLNRCPHSFSYRHLQTRANIQASSVCRLRDAKPAHYFHFAKSGLVRLEPFASVPSIGCDILLLYLDTNLKLSFT